MGARQAFHCMLPLLIGCSSGFHLPRDPNNSLGKIEEGKLRVGVSQMPPWTDTKTGFRGIEVELVEQLAEELQAGVQWTEESEGHLLRKLEKHELDLVISGLLKDTPWHAQVGLTKPYHVEEQQGEKLEHVWAVPPGENAWLLRVEQFLAPRRERLDALAGEKH